jgi:pyruvate dehydrogenase E2 component (dihydrolipoamide acetyltransferase)
MARVRLRGGALDGLDLHYVRAGEGAPTLLIHGLGGFAESWRHTIAGLAAHGMVLALDLPGFGASGKPRTRYRLEFLARAVEGFLDALDLERVHLVGHSLGGAVTVAHALAHPARVDRLALIAAVVPGFPFRPSLPYRLLALPGLGELAGWALTPGLAALAVRRCMVAADPAEVSFFAGHQFAVRATPEGRAAYLSALRSVRADFSRDGPAYRAGLADLDRPVLLIHGRQDCVVPIAHGQAVAAGLRRVRARWIERCGHFPQIEHADAVTGWLAGFLYAPAGSR